MKPQVSPLFLKDEELNDGVELFFFAHRDFARVADRWDGYAARPACAHRALAYKAVFKVLYY